MITFLQPYFQHSDSRGSIRGLVNVGRWEELNLVRSKPGIVRGNHYHREAEELFVILEGKINIKLQRVVDRAPAGEAEEHEVKAGDVFLIEKNAHHAFEILENSTWINALSRKTDQAHPDIVRLD